MITDITDANAEVDLGSEKKVAAAHFDSEQILAGQNRCILFIYRHLLKASHCCGKVISPTFIFVCLMC